MSESDVAKMKVADLKRELKLRGLSATGNKNELQERLQTALIDGELSLEDTAISGEDLLDGDDDAVLTDEEEAKILGADENELLKSPTTTPTTVADLSLDITKDVEEPTTTPVTKKIVLKRKSSFIGSSSTTLLGLTNMIGDPVATTTKENTEPSAAKVAIGSGHNPITLTNTGDRKDNAVSKVSQLSLQERLEMRAKKFGINTNISGATNKINRTDNKIVDSSTKVHNEQEIEMLKKRAERFGCVVSPKIVKLDVEEKLLKRKQRFGGTLNSDSEKSAASDVWAEKAQQRLERFKTSSSTEKSLITEK